MILLGQIGLDVAFLVQATALDQGLWTEPGLHRLLAHLAAVQHKQIAAIGGQPWLNQLLQQGSADLGILGGPSHRPGTRFRHWESTPKAVIRV